MLCTLIYVNFGVLIVQFVTADAVDALPGQTRSNVVNCKEQANASAVPNHTLPQNHNIAMGMGMGVGMGMGLGMRIGMRMGMRLGMGKGMRMRMGMGTGMSRRARRARFTVFAAYITPSSPRLASSTPTQTPGRRGGRAHVVQY